MILLDMQKEQFFRMTNTNQDDYYHRLILTLKNLGFDVRRAKFTENVPVDSVIYIGPETEYGSKYIFINDKIENSTNQRYQMVLCLSQYILASDKHRLMKVNKGLGEDLERSMALSILIPQDILAANEIVYDSITNSEEEKYEQLLLGMNISWQDLIDRKKELNQELPIIDLSSWDRMTLKN